LVNALCVGVLRKEDLHLAFASGAGNKIILFGARTGLDGIGGVSVLASETFGGDEPGSGRKKLPSVQVGDPFTEKVLIECCLELYAAGLVIGIQDLGGAGLSCATSELASAGDGGMAIELDTVPLRAKDMTPAEILSSESQERMCAVVAPGNVDAFMAVCRKWEVLATTIGEVTDGDRLQITWHGETVVDVPPRTVAHEGPVYQRPVARPESQDALNADTSAGLTRPATGDELRATLLALLGSPHLCSRAFITEQYDRYVRGNTVLAEHADGGVLRVDEATGRGIAVSTDASGRYTQLDPYTGAQLALAEAYRNVAVTGATPVAVTNCLNFGSPEDPGVMWQFSQAVRGLADGCAALGIPVTGGNVSFYNQTGTTAIMPTPVVGVLGVIDDVTRRIPTAMGTEPGETLILLGDTRDEFDGSIWAQVTADHLGGLPPAVDLVRERLLADVLSAASRDGLVSAAHDLSEGGLAQAVVESALAGETGCRIVLPEGADPFVTLFSESAGRVLVAVPRTEESRFTSMCEARGLPLTRIGVVDQASDAVEVQGLFTVPLAELRSTSEGVLAALLR
jgi:phosphoribosylformylglycinamidine synthase